MNAPIKQRWIEELRSGRYRQGYGQLNYAGFHCCLGVLCEIAVEEGIVQKTEDPHKPGQYGYGNSSDPEDNNAGLLPSEVVQWAGTRGSNPTIAGNKATEHNDRDRRTFHEIAALIESDIEL